MSEESELIVPDSFREFVSRLPSELRKKLSIHELRQLLDAAEIKLPWKRFGEEKPKEDTPIIFVLRDGTIIMGIYDEGLNVVRDFDNFDWSAQNSYPWLYESALLATVPRI